MSKKILSVVSIVLTFCVLMTMGVSAAAQADYYALDDYISKCVPALSNLTNGVYDEAELDSLSDLLYSFDHSLPSTSQSVVDGYLASLKTAVSNLTVDESKANAKFEITTDKTDVSTGDIVKVSVKLQTNYPIFSMQIPVLYDSTVFEMQNTSSVASSFLTFSGQMATGYVTNGNWNVASSMYKRNSNPSYWSSAEVMSKYKIALASWSVDSTRNIYPVTLNESEEIISFELKVISNEKDISGSIFLNSDWLKTASSRAGILTAGRAVGEVFGTASGAYKDVGQTVDLSDAVCNLNVNALDHEHVSDDGAVATEPTCTLDGEMVYSCTICGETLSTEVIPANGHTEVEIPAVEPTCLDGGFTAGTECSVCGEVIIEPEFVPANGHLADNGEITVPATCTEDGVMTYTCLNCGEVVDTEVITATGHTLENPETVTIDGKLYEVVKCLTCDEAISQTELFADYSEVEAAIASAEHIDGIYYSNYREITEAIDAVVYGLNAAEQDSVDAFAYAINSAVDGRIKVIDDLGLYYSSAAQSGNVITITSDPNATQIGVKTSTDILNKEVVIDKTGTAITQLSSKYNYRYQLKSANVTDYVQVAANRFEAVVNTTMTVNGVEYELVIVMVKVILTKADLRTMCVVDAKVDNDAKTVELTSREGAPYVLLYTENNGFKFDVDAKGLDNIDKPTTYRWYIYKTSETATTTTKTTVTINGELYTLTVKIVAAPFTPNKYIVPVNGSTFLGKYGEEAATVIQMTPGKSYVGMRTAGLGGATLEVDYENVPGLTLTKNSSGVPYIKAKALNSDNTDIVTTIRIICSNGTVYEMPLIFRFQDVSVSAAIVSCDYIETSRTQFDKYESTMTMYASTDSIARIRKTALNGLNVRIRSSNYEYVSDEGNYYEISCPFNKVATFMMNFDDEKGTRVIVTLYFIGYGESYNTAKLSVSNGSVTYLNDFTFKIQSSKSSMKVNEQLTTGETFAINTADYDFITYASGVYTIKQAGVGQTIKFTVDGVEYSGIVTK